MGGYMMDNTSCSCDFSVGFWDWNIPGTPGWISLAFEVWSEILGNITWQNTSQIGLFDNAFNRRRLLQLDVNCFDAFVSECDGSNQCLATNAPITPDTDNILKNIGQTFENWTDWTNGNTQFTEVDKCYCYWMYFTCFSEQTTTTTAAPMVNTTASETT